MKYKIWNKKEKINNVDAEYVINSLNIREEDGVFLIIDHLNEVQAIEIDRVIKSVYNLDKNLSVEEVAQEYIRIKEEEKLQAEKDMITLEEQGNKISILEAENETLKQELSITQDAVNELIFNSLNM